MTLVMLMRLVGCEGDAGAGSRELRTDACYVFTSSSSVIHVRRYVSETLVGCRTKTLCARSALTCA